MQFPAGAIDLFSSPKHPRQLGGGTLLLLSGYLGLFPGRVGGAQSERDMKLTLHLHVLLRIRMRATTP